MLDDFDLQAEKEGNALRSVRQTIIHSNRGSVVLSRRQQKYAKRNIVNGSLDELWNELLKKERKSR